MSTGLDWDGFGNTRRCLYWLTPFPIYDATYIFKAYPRLKTSPNPRYYTMFFWGNFGRFDWDSGNVANTFYGGHPFPVPAPTGPGQFELSVDSNDFLTGIEVTWNRWYTQVFRAWRDSSTITQHEFYTDWPDQVENDGAGNGTVIKHTVNRASWAATDPPTPSIVVGQTADFGGLSWGLFQGWEEYNGILRGMQFYDAKLSTTDIASEIASPGSTRTPWYLCLDPTPSDVLDRSGNAHHPSWDGSTRPVVWSDDKALPKQFIPAVGKSGAGGFFR